MSLHEKPSKSYIQGRKLYKHLVIERSIECKEGIIEEGHGKLRLPLDSDTSIRMFFVLPNATSLDTPEKRADAYLSLAGNELSRIDMELYGFEKAYLSRLREHVIGFGDAARENGDEETARKAYEAARLFDR
ncbi:MAG: hypothetical protein DRP03_03770 [Candidatus Aenigmatarchaeota archaeon]|nr:MAG: hypothetical protein DRP03_03770 [Candidatus Aenigmarchaeota archaeon]